MSWLDSIGGRPSGPATSDLISEILKQFAKAVGPGPHEGFDWKQYKEQSVEAGTAWYTFAEYLKTVPHVSFEPERYRGKVLPVCTIYRPQAYHLALTQEVSGGKWVPIIWDIHREG